MYGHFFSFSCCFVSARWFSSFPGFIKSRFHFIMHFQIKTNPWATLTAGCHSVRWGMGKREQKKKKFPGCPSLSYQSVICARRPPSSAAILRQHPGPQDAAGNTAGHRERCDNVTGCSRRRTLNTHVCTLTHTHMATQWIHIFMHTYRHILKGDTKTSTYTIWYCKTVTPTQNRR